MTPRMHRSDSTRRTRLSGANWFLLPDPEDAGKRCGWQNRIQTHAVPVQTPCCIEEHFPGTNAVAWYWYRFEHCCGTAEHHCLQFEGADYYAEAWLNGRYLGGDESAMLPFSFDATEALRDGENLLAVRVVNACYGRSIDGFRLGEVPGGRQHDDPWAPGHRFYNFGGLTGDVHLIERGAVWVADVFIQPDIDGQLVRLDIELAGEAELAGGLRIQARITKDYPVAEDQPLAAETCDVPGSSFQLAVRFTDFAVWSVHDAHLYRLTLELREAGGRVLDAWSDRFGMRRFTFKDARVHVNDQPVILRGALYNQIYPVTLGRPTAEMIRRDVESARDAGLNLLRMFSKPPTRAVLDACDEMGLLAHVETMAAWWMWDGPVEPRKRRLTDQMRRVIHAYRNHPCVLWWVCFNEPPADELLDYATDRLCPELRKLDPTRIILAADPNQPDKGDQFLPQQDRPETAWTAKHWYFFENLSITQPRSHCLNGDRQARIRQMRGRNLLESPQPQGKAFMLSEWGMPYMPDWDDLLACYAARADRADLEDYRLYRRLRDFHHRMYEKMKLAEKGFGTFRSLVRASQRAAAKRYDEYLTTLWGNVDTMGHCLTSLEDSSYEVSGLVDIWRRPKGAPFDQFRRLNQSVLLNLEVQPRSIYTDQRVNVDLTLVRDGDFKPGSYLLRLDCTNPHGQILWQQVRQVNVARRPIEMLCRTQKPVGDSEGQHLLQAYLFDGRRCLLSARRVIHVYQRPGKPPRRSAPVMMWDDDRNSLRRVLGRCVSHLNVLGRRPCRADDVILVATGRLQAGQADMLRLIFRAVGGGASAAFLDHQLFAPVQAEDRASDAPFVDTAKRVGAEVMQYFPAIDGWRPDPRLPRWGYGGMRYVTTHPIFAGLPTGCAIGETDVYARVCAADSFGIDDAPESVQLDWPVVYANSEALDPYRADVITLRYGKGRIVLTTMNLVPNLDEDPAADRIVLNIIDYLAECRSY